MAEIHRIGCGNRRLDQTSWKINPRSIVHTHLTTWSANTCLRVPTWPADGKITAAEIPMPGGCVIGNRPIDLHLRAMERLGASVELAASVVKVEATN